MIMLILEMIILHQLKHKKIHLTLSILTSRPILKQFARDSRSRRQDIFICPTGQKKNSSRFPVIFKYTSFIDE